MDTDSFAKLREIVLAVASAPPERRQEILVQSCQGDEALRAMVLRLLQFDPGESALDFPDQRAGDIGLLTALGLGNTHEPVPPAGTSEALGERVASEHPASADGIPGYRIIQKLGEGGMGAVYLAEDVKLGRRVALKFLRPELVAPGALTRFVHEARAAAAIDHPNICTVYGIHEARGQTFIAMAFIDGVTLRQRISEDIPSIDEALSIALQIGRGLAVTHEKGITHRDLKPSNVMLSNDGSVRIVDFGIAQSRDRPNVWRRGSRIGTVAYMSPEQLRGEEVGSRADLWALGVLLFEMFTGRLPFEGDSDDQRAKNILNHEAMQLSEVRDDVAPQLDELIQRCLMKSADDRPDASEFVRVVESVRPSSDGDFQIRQRRLRRLAVGGVATLALLAAFGWWRGWFSGGDAKRSEPRLTRLTVLPEQVSYSLLPGSISPDGQQLALPLRHLRGDWAALGVFSIETGRTRHIEGPTGEVYSVGWMPDSQTLLSFEYRGGLAWRERQGSEDSRSQIWLRDIGSDSSQMLYEHPHYTMTLWPVASPDGTKIAMYRGNRRGVWVMSTSGDDLRNIREVPSGEQINSLIWAPDGSRVAYVHSVDDGQHNFANIETCDLEGATTEVLARATDLDPGQDYVSLCWLPDGRMVFTRYTNFLWSTAAFWSMQVDPTTGLRTGAPESLLELEGAALGQPTVSRDGRRLAFYRWQANMRPYLLELDTSGDHIGTGRWTSQSWPAHPGAWTRHGGKLFFSVEVTSGNCDIFAHDMKTGLSEPVITTPAQDYVACLSPDGSDLLFWQGNRLKRMPLDGGDAVELFRSSTVMTLWWHAIERVMCSNVPGSNCILKRVEGDHTVFYEFDPSDGTLHGEIARVGFRLIPILGGRCDLSPDGQRIAIVANDTLWMLELVDGSLREIETDYTGSAYSVSWSGDSKWLCVTGFGGGSTRWMRRVDLDGHSILIWGSDEVGIFPLTRVSPDGFNVALPVVNGETDVWMIENF